MTDPGEPVVVRVATTPAEARLWTALLQAEGIAASVDGEMLTDEAAVSRRMLNLNGTRVLVPADQRERAVDILDNTKVDPAELEEQALTAAAPEALPERAAAMPRTGSLASTVALLLALAAAVTFLCLWLAANRHAGFDVRKTPTGERYYLPGTERLFEERFDRDGDGFLEEHQIFGPDGRLYEVQLYSPATRRCFRREEYYGDGTRLAWSEIDDSGRDHLCEVYDANNRLVRTLRYQPGQGFVETK